MHKKIFSESESNLFIVYRELGSVFILNLNPTKLEYIKMQWGTLRPGSDGVDFGTFFDIFKVKFAEDYEVFDFLG